MFKKLCLLSASLLLVGGTAFAEESAPYNCDFSPACEVAPGVYGGMASPVMSKFKLSIGGYVKLDYVHNSNAAGPRLQNPPNFVANPNDESIITAKQSRFWLKVAGPTLLGAKTNALIEADFYGGGGANNENQSMRIRHAWGSMDWATTQILFGQFWDIFGPATADTIDFYQGDKSGTPNAPRVPQVRLTQRFDFNKDNSLTLVVGAENNYEQNADPQGTSQGLGIQPASAAGTTFGSVPIVAGQLMLTSKALGVSPFFMGLGMSPMRVGVFGQWNKTKVNGGAGQVEPWGAGVYAFVPVVKSRDGKHRTMTLSLEGQVYKAAGLNIMGATAGGLASATAGQEKLARGLGYYGQLKFYPTQDLGLTAGYEQRHVDHAQDFGAAVYEKYNSLTYVNATYDLNAAIRLAAEYEYNEAKRVGAAPDAAHNDVIRLAAYYFF